MFNGRWQELPPTAGLPLKARDFGLSTAPDLALKAAEFLAAPYTGVACSGTACLVCILNALKKLAPSRDTVIIPAYNCPLVVLAIAHCGLRVVLCDLNAEGIDMDHAMLSLLCNERTLAVIPAHIGGRVMNVAAAARIAHAQGAFIVEDAAQAFGARVKDESVGLQADAGFFSLAVGKGLTLYEGGIWVTKDTLLAQTIAASARQVLKKAPGKELQRCLELAAYALVYRPGLLRLFYGNALRHDLARGKPEEAVGDVFDADFPLHGISRWRQRIGCHAMNRLPEFLKQTSQQARSRLEILNAIPGIQTFDDMQPDAQGVWPVLLVQVPQQNIRDRIMDELWGSGLGVSRMFIHALPDYAYLRPWLAAGELPHARALAARTLTVTNSLWLDDTGFSTICSVLRRYL